MHADWLSVTTSEEHALSFLEEFTPMLASLGVVSAYKGLYKLQEGGSFMLKPIPQNNAGFVVGASGGFLARLRAQNLFAEYLTMLGCYPHRVTRLDIARDLPCYASPHVLKFVRDIRKDKFKINGRKINKQTGYNSWLSEDDRGNLSGTVYIGPKKPQKAAFKFYDKRKEQLDKFGRIIPPTLRQELKLGRKVGATLRDAAIPEPIFWHHVRDILPVPDGVPDWEPHAEGFDLGARVTLLPAESLKRLVESSDLLPRLYTLCDQVGPHGFDYLVRLLKDAHDSHCKQNEVADTGS